MTEGTQKLGLPLTAEQQAAFQCYRDELVAWNMRANLTAITDNAGIQAKHFIDSLSCLKAITPLYTDLRLVDVGTGAGFPGLPLKIVWPALQLTLIESTGKKVDFLKHIIAKLGLRHVTILKARAEDVGRQTAHREQYDWGVARAVAEMATLAEYLLPLIKIGGKMLAQKNDAAPAEVAAAQTAIHHLGGRVNRLIPLELHGIAETRYLVVIDKIAATPDRYPRRAGMPAKKPILA